MFANTRRFAGLAVLLAATAALAKPVQSGRQSINGVDYYFEVHGKGEPVLLLHGGLGSIEMFGAALEQLAQNRKVIAVDLHGHGRTALGKREWKLELQGDDMAVLVKRLGHEQVDVIGYSMGGGVALRMAIQKPKSVRRLALVSCGFSSNEAFHADVRALQVQLTSAAAEGMKETPMYKTYAALAPKVEDFPKLIGILGDLMRKEYDWSKELSKIEAQVLLVYGDSDMFRLDHAVKFYQLLGGDLRDAGWQRENQSKHRLAIIPDATHYDIFTTPRLIETLQPFLDGKREVIAWKFQK